MPPHARRRAFSLIELLVVIVVIALIVAIILPALGGARNTARKASTAAQLAAISGAAQQFENDNQRAPGLFTARQMGDMDNEDRGFTVMENIMLDLAGGVVEPSGPALGGQSDTIVEVGPTSDATVLVDLDLIGTTQAGGGYYTPDAGRFVPQDGIESGTQFTTSVENHTRLPDVVDAFGTPVLAWQADRTAIQPVEEVEDFVRISSPTSASEPPARFYWASNAGFLRSEELGKQRKDITFRTATSEHSVIAEDVTESQRLEHLMVLLGAPTIPSGDTPPNVFPSAPRGQLLFHSAGRDAVYLGSKDKGGRTAQTADGLVFWRSFYGDSGDRLVDGEGQVESIDLLDQFDDIIQTAGN
ncbi:MAG: prepilin-type N-terminal cleavage/methylation domain-containing protein [Planctomycetota bacterium]